MSCICLWTRSYFFFSCCVCRYYFWCLPLLVSCGSRVCNSSCMNQKCIFSWRGNRVHNAKRRLLCSQRQSLLYLAAFTVPTTQCPKGVSLLWLSRALKAQLNTYNQKYILSLPTSRESSHSRSWLSLRKASCSNALNGKTIPLCELSHLCLKISNDLFLAQKWDIFFSFLVHKFSSF